MEKTALVIGAGVAGLAAAEVLARAGVQVTVIEARDRIGGRIHTVPSRSPGVPIELGAEFIHGARNATWEIIRTARLDTQEVPDRHWRFCQGKLREEPQLWKELSQVFEQINTKAPDQDFQSYLEPLRQLPEPVKRLALDYVEGFHAAPAGRASIHALARAEQSAEEHKGSSQFRFTTGYSALLDWFAAGLDNANVQLRLNTRVQRLKWEPGQVEIAASTREGDRKWRAKRAVVALPLGVLKASGADVVVFEPDLQMKQEALHGLEMGSVCKLALLFRERFWPVENFGFIHADGAMFPTWWSDPRGPILTAWAGGPRAERLSREGQDPALEEALKMLSSMFAIGMRTLRDLLVANYSYNWDQDPFSRGAYSFTPVNMSEMPRRLAAPVAGTLFFAGEATNAEGEQGTVHAAISSGRRAAHELLGKL